MPIMHLAVFVEPYLSLVLSGQKTIESRFSKIRCAPYGSIEQGDIVLIKESGGPIRGEFRVGRVDYWSDPERVDLKPIQTRFGDAICANADPAFWDLRAKSKYVTLIHIRDVKPYTKPRPFSKRGRQGWVVLGPVTSVD